MEMKTLGTIGRSPKDALAAVATGQRSWLVTFVMPDKNCVVLADGNLTASIELESAHRTENMQVLLIGLRRYRPVVKLIFYGAFPMVCPSFKMTRADQRDQKTGRGSEWLYTVATVAAPS